MSARRQMWLAGAVVAVALAVVITRGAMGSTDLQSDGCNGLLAQGGSSVDVSMGAVARTGDVTFGVDGGLGQDGSIKLFPSTDDALPPTPPPLVVHVGEQTNVNGTTVCVAAAHENRFNVRPGGAGTLTIVYI